MYGQMQFNMKNGALMLDHVSMHGDDLEPITSKVEICIQYKCISFMQGDLQFNLFFHDEAALRQCVDDLYEKAHQQEMVSAIQSLCAETI